MSTSANDARLDAATPVRADTARQLQRERDDLLLLHEALADVERARSTDARLRVLVEAIRRIGFGRVTITLRDVDLNATAIVTSGLMPEEDELLRAAPVSGEAWRRRMASIERFRISNSYYLEGRDPWVRAEFGGGLPSMLAEGDDPDWSPRDTLLVPLHSASGTIVATLVLDDPADRARPTLARVRTVELFAQQVASTLEHASLRELAERRARRLQSLHDVGSLLAGSLDEPTILRSLAAQVEAVLPVVTVVVLTTDAAGAPWPRVLRRGGVETDEMFTAQSLRAIAAQAATEQQPARDGGALAVPTVLGSSTVAVIVVETANGEALDAPDADLLVTIGGQGASAISNARLYAESIRQQRRAEALADVVRVVGESLRIDRVLELILRHATALLRTDGAAISLLRGDILEVTEGVGVGHALVGSKLPVEGSIGGHVIRTASSVIREDLSADHNAFGPSVAAAQIRNTIIVPLLSVQGPVGVLAVFNRIAPFTDDDAEFLQRLADQVSVAIVNARLFEEAERYRRVVETSRDAIVITDRERRIMFANPAAHELLDRGPDLIGLPGERAVPDNQRGEVRRREDRALAGEPQSYEGIVLRPDGGQRIVAIATAPLRELGEVTGIVASLRDVTDERRARDEVARSESRYRNLVESVTDAIFTVDEQGRFTAVNRALAHAVGRDRDSLIGASFADFIDARDLAAAERLLHETYAGERSRAALRYRGIAGEPRQGSIITSPVFEGKRIVGALGIMRDVTDERRLADQLLQQEKLVAVGQLVSGVAHELNNPLAGVMAFAQLLLSSPVPLDDEPREAVETIHREARRAAKIVSSLLTFARQQPAERSATRLNELISDTLELRRYSLRTTGVQVTLDLDPTLPVTWADPFQLQQVILNLLANAEQALAEHAGDRTIVVRTSRRGADLVVSVSDNGPGIQSDLLDRIFNPFFTTKAVGQGTGLGLSISDGIVREHGGRIRVESSPGAGATFTVELPWVSPQAGPVPDTPPPRAAAVGPRRMLVVDDEPAMRAAVSGFLASLGNLVHVAANGLEARALLEKTEYDVVLLDLRMPDLGGESLYRELCERDLRHARRVVFVTGDLQSEDAQRFLKGAGRPVIGKPFQLDDLAAILASVTT